jgi:UrcA family protein
VELGYADRNVARPEGPRVLYQHIVDAAQRLYPEAGYVTELRQNRDAQRCVRDTVERTLKQIRSPQFAQGVGRQRR